MSLSKCKVLSLIDPPSNNVVKAFRKYDMDDELTYVSQWESSEVISGPM